MSTTQLSSTVPRHRRRLSTVQRAGLSILAHAQSAVRGSRGPRRNRNVLKHVSTIPAVLLSIGRIVGNARDILQKHRIAVLIVQTPHSLKSSDDVSRRLVRDINEYFS